MMRAAIIAAVFLMAGAAAALPPYAVHPAGTDPVATGKLIIEPGADRACLNVPLLAVDPTTPANGDVWFVHTVSRHQGCIQMGGVTRCWDAEEVP